MPPYALSGRDALQLDADGGCLHQPGDQLRLRTGHVSSIRRHTIFPPARLPKLKQHAHVQFWVNFSSVYVSGLKSGHLGLCPFFTEPHKLDMVG
jgi:hypothetical protein